jgi:hypothetical protein
MALLRCRAAALANHFEVSISTARQQLTTEARCWFKNRAAIGTAAYMSVYGRFGDLGRRIRVVHAHWNRGATSGSVANSRPYRLERRQRRCRGESLTYPCYRADAQTDTTPRYRLWMNRRPSARIVILRETAAFSRVKSQSIPQVARIRGPPTLSEGSTSNLRHETDRVQPPGSSGRPSKDRTFANFSFRPKIGPLGSAKRCRLLFLKRACHTSNGPGWLDAHLPNQSQEP